MRIWVYAAAVMSTSLVTVLPAQADSVTNDFLSRVSGEGVNVGDTPADVQLTLATAAEICDLIHTGYTPEVAGRQLKYHFPTITPQQTTGFVDAAQATLCPHQFAPLEPGGY